MDEHHVEMTVRLQVGKAHGCLTEDGNPGRSAEAPFGPCVAINLSPCVNLFLIVVLKGAALHAEKIERELSRLDAALSGADDISAGTVRLTSVPIIVNHILVPAAPILLKRHPGLQLELIGDARDFSLTRREADLALRLARPKTGGTRLITRRVGTVRYGVYASASCSPRDARVLPWITYDETMAHLPQARWIAATVDGNRERIASVRVNDAEAVLEAVMSGAGRSLLPCVIAEGNSRLRRLDAKRQAPALTRELWLLAHSALRTLARIEAVVAWIEQIAPR